MYRNIILAVFLLSVTNVFGQAPEFYPDVARIIHMNCTPCHKPGGAAPFSLITYEDVARRADFIGHVTRTRYMPPWYADADFGEFRNERRLSEDQISTIQQWIANGLKRGEEPSDPDPESHLSEEGHSDVGPDLELTLSSSFTIPGDNSEQFMFFNVPTNLPTDGYISSIEFVPGNKKLVHHSRIMSDTSNLIRGIDRMSETDPRVREFMKIPLFDQFLYGWVPGNFKFFFPPGTGKKIHKNTDLIVNIHYAPTPVTASDRSRIRIYLSKEKVSREVKTITITEDFISNQPFVIPAGEVKTFYARTAPLRNDLSIIAVLPHMHLLGKSMMAYALTPAGDIIKLIKISDWNFKWQSTYQYKHLVKIPKGSVLYVQATYDNTTENKWNPNSPPKEITYGWNSTDEMMNFIIYALDYQPGDEHWEY